MLYFRCNCSLRRSLLYGTFHRRQEWLTIGKGTAMRTRSICESKKEIDTKVESGMKNFVITIGREFGSGGHNLGQSLAKELEIPCYDRHPDRGSSGVRRI